MPIKTYRKPNRTKARVFKSCDVARIAREVVKDDKDTTPEEVLACIAKGMGFTYVSLSRVTSVEQAIIKPKTALIILEKSIPILEKLILKSKTLARVLGPVIVALKKALDFIERVSVPSPPQEEVDKVINKDKCSCKGDKGVNSNTTSDISKSTGKGSVEN